MLKWIKSEMIQHKVNNDNEWYFHFYSYDSNRLDITRTWLPNISFLLFDIVSNAF